MMDCIFCKIIAGTIPAKKILENDHAIVIADIQPQAKKHFLVIPKTHVANLDEAFADDQKGREIVGQLHSLSLELVKKEGLLPGGFRSVFNTNEDGGQTVFHLHMHILGGEKLKGSFA